MKLAIMQPYFFPYLGYFSLLKHTEKFILFDVVQFIKHGWIERNRILRPVEGWQYIKVPLVKHSLKTLIKDIRIKSELDWREKILAQLVHYKKAPYYNRTVEIIEESLNINTESIVVLNKNILETICKYLRIKVNIEIFSEMSLDIKKPEQPDEWALNICTSLGNVAEYRNLPSGKNFFKKEKYDKKNIKLTFHETILEKYSQQRAKFETGLAIIDVMMFNSIEKINEMLNNYKMD